MREQLPRFSSIASVIAALLLGLSLAAVGCAPAESGEGRDAGSSADTARGIDGNDTGGRDAFEAGETSDGRWPDVDAASCGRYAVDGPHTVGVTTLMIDGESVEVWYPAADGSAAGNAKASYDMREWLPADERQKIPDDKAPKWEMDAHRDVDASSKGPFPLVLFSHGFGGYRMQSTFLTVHLASWGYVVASADHPGRTLAAVLETDLSGEDEAPETMNAVWDELERRASEASGRFAGLVDGSNVAVTGHSAGASSVIELAGNRDVDAVVGYAGGPMNPSSPLELGAPSYLMSAEDDDIVRPSRVKSAWDALTPPKRYLEVAEAGHLVFSDICLIGRERGGVLAIADRNGVDVPSFLEDLGSDGCGEDELPPEIAWPMIQHFTTAHLQVALGRDSSPVDLGEAAHQCFEGLVASHAAKLQ